MSQPACEPPLVQAISRQPGTGGAAAEPTNGIVVITYTGTATELASPELALLDAQSAVVPSTVTELPQPGRYRHVYKLAPLQPLVANATYYLADTIDWECTAEPCRVAQRKTTVFGTIGASDGTPPSTPPAPKVTTHSTDACTGGACACGTYHALLTMLENPATEAVRYDLYDGTTLVQTNAPFVIATDCAQAGDVAYPALQPAVALAPGVHHLAWHGFDLAGNEATGPTADIDLECPAVTPPPDANMGSGSGDAGIGPAHDESSCNASGGTNGALLAIGIVVALRRRQLRSASTR